ncbi:MAG: aminotransferase class V-fold PLP-dependent enzyme [Armatimonadetes bacterium]|nr:aminotransferase class V-fold PLP-dependent enzyme [Armatimonadota bacterium]
MTRSGGTIYLDNAATSFPKPETVYVAMDRFLREAAANPGRAGHARAVAASRVVQSARVRLARLLGVADARRVVWCAGATAALNLALKGSLRPGDRVVTSHLEHNAVARPLRALERTGVRVERVPCSRGSFDPLAFVQALSDRPALAVLTHASNVTGEVLPLAEVGAECRRLGVRFLIDAAQTAGSVELRAEWADLVALPGHKGLLGPPGTGALVIGPGVELTPLMEGGTGSESERDEQPEGLPERFESGTLNSVGLAGLDAGLAWLEATGPAAVHRREQEWVARLWHGLGELPSAVRYGPPPAANRAAVLSFNLVGWEPSDLAAVLDSEFGIQVRAGLHCAPWAHQALGTAPAGTVRLSPGFFNTESDIEATLDAVRQVAGGN